MTRWLLKTVAADGAAHGGFVWPLEVGAEVAAPDWSDAPKCGGGLHGLLDGRGDGGLLSWSLDAVWLVAEVPADAHLVDLGSKVKVDRCVVAHVGDQASAIGFLADQGVVDGVVGAHVVAGYRGTATVSMVGMSVAVSGRAYSQHAMSGAVERIGRKGVVTGSRASAGGARHLTPVPPSSASVDEDGALKDTPANRALHPASTSMAIFRNKKVREGAVHADDRSILLCGDVEEQLQKLIDAKFKVDCIVTSPPYYGQRDYGVDGQIGHEEHPGEFIDKLVGIFGLCRELLRDTGSMWINIGDTYWSGKGAHKSKEVKQGARRFGLRPQDRPGDGKWTRPKQLLLIPHRLAIALQDDGWLVRNDNVWVKPNPVPDQVRDRCSMSHEYVFHLTNNRWYYFNRQQVGRLMPSGSLLPPLDTWEVPPSTGNGNHKASFSQDLLRIPVLSTTPPNGIVLDPFNGSGTSTLFARANGFRSIGIDISAAYCAQAAEALTHLDAALTVEPKEGYVLETGTPPVS